MLRVLNLLHVLIFRLCGMVARQPFMGMPVLVRPVLIERGREICCYNVPHCTFRMLPETIGYLYVGGQQTAFSAIKVGTNTTYTMYTVLHQAERDTPVPLSMATLNRGHTP